MAMRRSPRSVEPFDAIVLDLSMPGRSGFDLLAEIKHRARSCRS